MHTECRRRNLLKSREGVGEQDMRVWGGGWLGVRIVSGVGRWYLGCWTVRFCYHIVDVLQLLRCRLLCCVKWCALEVTPTGHAHCCTCPLLRPFSHMFQIMSTRTSTVNNILVGRAWTVNISRCHYRLKIISAGRYCISVERHFKCYDAEPVICIKLFEICNAMRIGFAINYIIRSLERVIINCVYGCVCNMVFWQLSAMSLVHS